MIDVKSPLFRLGKIVATSEAISAMKQANATPWLLLSRHVQGDFGEVDAEDRQANLEAIENGERVLSVYTLSTGQRLYVITEADRSSTCVLRVEDY